MKNKYEIGEKTKLVNVTFTAKQTGESFTLLDKQFLTVLGSRDVEEEFDIHVYAVTVQVCYYRPLAQEKRRYFGKMLTLCSSYFSLNQNEDFANNPPDLKSDLNDANLHPECIWQPRGLEDTLLPNVVFLTRDYFSQFVQPMVAANAQVTKLIVDKVSAKLDETHSPSNHFDTLSAAEKKTEIRDFTYTTISMINDALYQQEETVLLRAKLYCYKSVNNPDEIKDVFLDIVSILLEQSCQPALARGRYIADDVIYRTTSKKEHHTYFLNAAFFLDKKKLTSLEHIEEILVKAWIGAVGYSRQEFVDVLERGWLTLDADILHHTAHRVLTASYDDYSYCIDKTLPFLLDGTSETKQISYSQHFQIKDSVNDREPPNDAILGHGWNTTNLQSLEELGSWRGGRG